MSDYTLTTNFAAKDGLPDTNPDKTISGTEFYTEFTALETAVNSKADSTEIDAKLDALDPVVSSDGTASFPQDLQITQTGDAGTLGVNTLDFEGDNAQLQQYRFYDGAGNVTRLLNGAIKLPLVSTDFDSATRKDYVDSLVPVAYGRYNAQADTEFFKSGCLIARTTPAAPEDGLTVTLAVPIATDDMQIQLSGSNAGLAFVHLIYVIDSTTQFRILTANAIGTPTATTDVNFTVWDRS